MPYPANMKTRLVLLLGLVGCAQAAVAAGPPPPLDDGHVAELAIRFSQLKTDFRSAAGATPTTVDWIDVSWREDVAPRLQLGLYGGRSYVTQTDNPYTAGATLDGYHAGVSVLGTLLAGRRASLALGANYTWERVENSTGGQQVVLTWQEPRVRLLGVVRLLAALRAYGGVSYGVIDGEQQLSGPVNQTAPFHERRRDGEFLGLDLNVDQGGYVGAEADFGLYQGVQIYFKRRF